MILLIGASGRLGNELVKLREYLTPSSTEFDLTDTKKMTAYLAKNKPDLIVHCAGYVKSLEPETDAMEAIKCYTLNVLATKSLVRVAQCPIVYISTEGVIEPYNMYTISKLLAENVVKKHPQHLIIRTNFWPRPFPFPKAANDLYTIGDYIDVVAEQIDDYIGLYEKSLTDGRYDFNLVYSSSDVKTVYDLAKQTVPDIEGVPCETFGIPKREGLLKI